MRLASKIFLATSAVIVGLVAVTVVSLLALNHVVQVNRAIVTRAVPALRLETFLHESMHRLVWLERRHAVLRDPVYASLWRERVARLAADLELLRDLLANPDELHRHDKTTAALERYRAVVERSKVDAALATERVLRTLQRLTKATSTAVAQSREETRILERRTWNAIMLALPLTLLVALLGAALFSRRLTGSLERLSEATQEVASGSFVAVVPAGRDEVGRLGAAFNRMVERLGEIDRLKQELFSNISHELRTPLTAVQEAAHLLREEVPGPLTPKQARLIDIVSESTARVLRLVNRILELSRLRAGLLALERRSVKLDGLVSRALDELRPQAEARGLTLEQDGSPIGASVLGDEERLLEVLVNLLGNAVKFTPAGGRVRVDVAARPGEVEVAVADTGPGIPAKDLPRVFDRYWQGGAVRGGTGLGLAIVKTIVEMHGGRVHAESREGAGSRFVMCLPRDGGTA